MCMHHPELSVIPLTNHIPLSSVPHVLQKTKFHALKNAIVFFYTLFQKTEKPGGLTSNKSLKNKKIAFTGLNPHAGENGKIGNEEEYLRQLISDLKSEITNSKSKITKIQGIKSSHASNKMFSLEGPLPADGVFSASVRPNYSLIVTCYHDQALIPFKALYGASGINITLNLPLLRVSPDHGPAYDCAGKNNADMESVIQSLKFAFQYADKWRTIWTMQYSSQ